MTSAIRDKAKAAALHLLICVVVALVVYAGITRSIYPSPLLQAMGGMEIFLLILTIDIIVGPILTFIVFRREKPSLKFDLTVIAMLQMVALAYGVYTLWAGRPAYIAALGDRFEVIPAAEVEKPETAGVAFQRPTLAPIWVGYARPTDPKAREKMLMSALSGKDYGHFPQYHAPIDTMAAETKKYAKPLSELKRLNASRVDEIDAWLQRRGVEPSQASYLGLKARHQPMAVVVRTQTGEIIGIAPFTPWE
jgi:hypothetical protein